MCVIAGMGLQLTKVEIEAGLAYCRLLRARRFNESLKAISPFHNKDPFVLLDNTGKDVYRQILPIVRGRAQLKGVVVLDEPWAVVQYLAELKGARGGGAVSLTVGLSRVQKFVSNGKRTIRGLANSGQLDRVGDIVDPKGGSWTLPVPLLWQHQHDQPIGWVRSIDARNDGLWITAELAEGIGKSDEAWRAIEAGLVDSYSIGFTAYEWDELPHGGRRFVSWTLLEISVVTVPADSAAKIQRGARTTIKARGDIPAHPGAVRLLRGAR